MNLPMTRGRQLSWVCISLRPSGLSCSHREERPEQASVHARSHLLLRLRSMAQKYIPDEATDLLSAVRAVESRLSGTSNPGQRWQEFVSFLEQVDAHSPPGLELHLVVDSSQAPQHPEVLAWLERHPRFRLHSAPTGGEWRSLIEQQFRENADERIRDGAPGGLKQLLAAIGRHVAQQGGGGEPFFWAAPDGEVERAPGSGSDASCSGADSPCGPH